MINPTISIALCTYQGTKFIIEQLVSIANQTRVPDEVIIVDDASRDNTVMLLNAFKDNNKLNIKIYKNDINQGVIKSFERAIALCTSDIIFLADQDDVWDQNKISEHLKVYVSNPDCGYVFSDATLVSEDLIQLGNNLWKAINFNPSRYSKYTEGQQLEVMLNGGNFVYGNTMSFRAAFKNIILPIESTSHGCTHDVWISHILSSLGYYGVGLPLELIKYRQHINQQAGAGRKQSFSNQVKGALKSKQKYYIDKSSDLAAISKVVKLKAPQRLHEIELIDLCSQHFKARAAMYSASIFKLIYSVTTELFSGRYSSYSSSWRSALNDLLITRRYY